MSSRENSARAMYKAKGKSESSTSSRRKSRGLERKKQRDDEVNKRRLLSDDMSPIVEDHDQTEERKEAPREKAATRAERLKQWREGRKRKMEEEKKNSKKPMFKVSHLKYQGETELYKWKKDKPNLDFVKQSSSVASLPTKFMAKPVGSTTTNKTGKKEVKAIEKQKAAPISQPKTGKSGVPAMSSTRNKTSQSTITAPAPAVAKNRPSTRNGPSAKPLQVKSEVGSQPAEKKQTRQRGKAPDLSTKLTASAAAKAKLFEKPKEFLRAKPHLVTRSATQAQKEMKAMDKKSGSKKKDCTPQEEIVVMKTDDGREGASDVEMPAVPCSSNESEHSGSSSDQDQDLHLSDSAVSIPKHSTPTVTSNSSKKMPSSSRRLSGSARSSRRKSRRSKKGTSTPQRSSKNSSVIYATTEIAMNDEQLEQHEVSPKKTTPMSPIAMEGEGSPEEKDLAQDLLEEDVAAKEIFHREDNLCEEASSFKRKSLQTGGHNTDESGTSSDGSDRVTDNILEPSSLDISNKENSKTANKSRSYITELPDVERNKRISTPKKTTQNMQEPEDDTEIKLDTCSKSISPLRPRSLSAKRRRSQVVNSAFNDASTDDLKPTPSKRQRRSVAKPVPKIASALNIFPLDNVSKEDQISSVEYPTPVSQQRVRMSSALSKRRSLRLANISSSSQSVEMENEDTQAPLFETASSLSQIHWTSPATSKRKSVKITVPDQIDTTDNDDTQAVIEDFTAASPVKSGSTKKSKRKSKRLNNPGKNLMDGSETDTQAVTEFMTDSQLIAPPSISKRKSLRLSNLQNSIADGSTESENETGTDRSQMLKLNKRQSRRMRSSSVRRSGVSTVVSVSDEGTSKVLGDSVVDSVHTPAVLNCENSRRGSSVSKKSNLRRSVHSSEVFDISDEKVDPADEKTDSANILMPEAIYQVIKPAESETESRVLQELPVEKVGEDLSYIEVPLDDSLNKSRSMSSPPPVDDTTTEYSSQSTEPFTPRKSGEVSSLNHSSPLAKASPPATATSSAKTPPTVTEPVQSSPITATPLSTRRRGRSVAPTPTFKTPGHPTSAFKTKSERRRRKTEHTTPTKSPEEMIEILKKSPMIEMNRRRSRHVSSPAMTTVNPVNFDDLFAGMSPSQQKPNKSASELTVINTGLLDATVKTDADIASTSNTDPTSTMASMEPAETLVTSAIPSAAEKVKPFRDLLTNETNRLNEMCNKWSEISDLTVGLGEDIQGQIRSTIGKAQLLINQRFKQFSGLVDDCEFERGEKETTVTDLQGFWEMIYFQVEDIDKLFARLSALQQNDWKEQEVKPVKNLIKKKAPVKVTKPKIKSNFASFRMELMKRKAQATAKTSVVDPSENEENTKEFDAGFFKVTSPVKSPSGRKSAQNTPLKPTTAASSTPALTDCQTQVEKTNEKPKTVVNSSHPSTPISQGKENTLMTTPSHSKLMTMSAKRLSYVPVIPSPLLNDITDVQVKKL